MEDKNINYIENEEIYLKRGPEIIKSDRYIGKFEEKKYNLDYSGTSSFWLSTITSNNCIIISECICSDSNKIYSSQVQLNKEFIKLSEFLQESTFIGRKFRRTQDIHLNSHEMDDNYMLIENTNNKRRIYTPIHIVLYATKELFLVKKIDKLLCQNEYIVINSKYISDGNYEFYGPVYEEYKDTNKVYYEIQKQVEIHNKQRVRKK